MLVPVPIQTCGTYNIHVTGINRDRHSRICGGMILTCTVYIIRITRILYVLHVKITYMPQVRTIPVPIYACDMCIVRATGLDFLSVLHKRSSIDDARS